MKYAEAAAQIADYRRQIHALREKLLQTRRAAQPEPVQDYELHSAAGAVRLSQLFGGHDDLIVVHNMGKGCPACTMWADGYNGLHPHLSSRAAFVVSSPDAPEVQRQFAATRGWRFPMVSHAGSTFAADMGYRSGTRWLPGVSVFRRSADGLARVGDTGFSPGDDFCATYHFFDLLPQGAGDWHPKFSYGAAGTT